ncbi:MULTISPECIES: hypothetical protein [unclassified Haladaptatus]|uniref:hypothetical protein n=1 Tax=unclassified Haladaptatus TaxID=2622732 RepID=UPI002FCDF49C
MSNEKTRVTFGTLALLVSTIVLFAISFLGSPVPVVLGALAALGMAAGSLLIGTSETGRPV